MFYVKTVNLSASVREWQLIHVKNFESDSPEEKVVYTSNDHIFTKKITKEGNVFVESSRQEINFGNWFHQDIRYLCEYIVFNEEGEKIDIPTCRGGKTFVRDWETIGIGWIGTNENEKYKYGFIYADGITCEDETVTEIYKKSKSVFLFKDILVYSDDKGIHAYSLNDGRKADIIVDPAYRIFAVAGNYVYYGYEIAKDQGYVYRVRLDGTGWEETGILERY